MTKSLWNPYWEADNHLPEYNFIYKTIDLYDHFDHPQILEDYLFEMAPHQFCCGLCYNLSYAISGKKILYGFIAVKDPSIATWIKLQTGVSPIDKSEYCLKMSINDKWEMYLV